MRRLSLRAHSRAELEEALKSKEVAPEVGAELLDRFTELDLVDDAAFAEQWVSSRHRTRQLSRRALAEELRRKGVDREVISEATAAVTSEDEFEAALALGSKKMRSMARVDDPLARRRRLAGALARRGYGPEIVHRVVGQLLAGDSDERAHEVGPDWLE